MTKQLPHSSSNERFLGPVSNSSLIRLALSHKGSTELSNVSASKDLFACSPNASRADGYAVATRIDGYAVDMGVSYRTDLPWRPTIVAGYALGSGRSDTAGRLGFRQTGLQDNNGRFGGVTSFRYYGEVLEPELANLHVSTLAVGVRPTRDSSVDLVHHFYRQDEASTRLVHTNLRADPNGVSRTLGWGLDLVLGYRHGYWLRMEVVSGLFRPGSGFDNDDMALKVEGQIRFRF